MNIKVQMVSRANICFLNLSLRYMMIAMTSRGITSCWIPPPQCIHLTSPFGMPPAPDLP